jgi:hypothetical protein
MVFELRVVPVAYACIRPGAGSEEPKAAGDAAEGNRLRLGVALDEPELPFPAENGRPWHPDMFSVHWCKPA